MSIINDALKKAGTKNQPYQLAQPTRKKWPFWMAAGAACLLGMTLAINFFDTSSDFLPVEQASSEVVPESAFQLKEVDYERTLKVTDFNLSGILYDNQKPLALINDKIVEEGAFIGEAKLLEIHPDYVRLSLKGEELTLKIK